MTRFKLRHLGLTLVAAAGLCVVAVLALFAAGIVAGFIANYHPVKTIEVVHYVNRSTSAAAPSADRAPEAADPGTERAR